MRVADGQTRLFITSSVSSPPPSCSLHPFRSNTIAVSRISPQKGPHACGSGYAGLGYVADLISDGAVQNISTTFLPQTCSPLGLAQEVEGIRTREAFTGSRSSPVGTGWPRKVSVPFRMPTGIAWITLDILTLGLYAMLQRLDIGKGPLVYDRRAWVF